MKTAEAYQRFISWQCRLRKLSMRELGGRPSAGMSAGIHALAGGGEQARINFLLLKRDSRDLTANFRHIVRKTQDPRQRVDDGLKILAEWHYQRDEDFSPRLTALFSLDSGVAAALTDAGQCRLKFAETSIEHEFDFDVCQLPEADEAFQFTYWHNHLFNPALPGKVQVLGFDPRL